MNAHALLTNQGWLGPGHALDSRLTDYGAPTYKQKGHRGLAYDPNEPKKDTSTITNGNGLVKPLLISQRHGSRYGIGKKAHEPHSGNQWWLKGFQSALENVGKSESERSSGTSTPQNGAANGYTGKHSGLYGYFVQGQLMKGTIHESDPKQDENQMERKSKKRKSDVLGEQVTLPAGSAIESQQHAAAVSSAKRLETTKDLESSIPYLAEIDKHRKKNRHERTQSTHIEQFATIGQFFDVAEAEQKKRRRKKNDEHLNGVSNDVSNGHDIGGKGDQESGGSSDRAYQQQRRKKKNRTLAEMVEEELAKLNSMSNSTSAAEDDTEAEKLRLRAERKKRRKEKDLQGIRSG